MTYDPVDANDDGIVESDVDNESVSTDKLDSTGLRLWDGDGTLQSAIDDATNDGVSTLYVPSGTYGGISTTSQIHIKGYTTDPFGESMPKISATSSPAVNVSAKTTLENICVRDSPNIGLQINSVNRAEARILNCTFAAAGDISGDAIVIDGDECMLDGLNFRASNIGGDEIIINGDRNIIDTYNGTIFSNTTIVDNGSGNQLGTGR